MVLKELPGKKASSEGNPLLTVTTKVGMTTTLLVFGSDVVVLVVNAVCL